VGGLGGGVGTLGGGGGGGVGGRGTVAVSPRCRTCVDGRRAGTTVATTVASAGTTGCSADRLARTSATLPESKHNAETEYKLEYDRTYQ